MQDEVVHSRCDYAAAPKAPHPAVIQVIHSRALSTVVSAFSQPSIDGSSDVKSTVKKALDPVADGFQVDDLCRIRNGGVAV